MASLLFYRRARTLLAEFLPLGEPRWIAERTFGWLNRSRRLTKDFEASMK
jgi:hypothetical protein